MRSPRSAHVTSTHSGCVSLTDRLQTASRANLYMRVDIRFASCAANEDLRLVVVQPPAHRERLGSATGSPLRTPRGALAVPAHG